MDNRRPPRPNSPGRKPYFDRSGGAPSFRGGRPGGRGPGRSGGPSNSRGTDTRYQDGAGRSGDQRRDARPPSGDFRRGDGGKRFGPPRFDRNDSRGRTRDGRNPKVEVEIKITSDAQITDGRLRGKLLLNSNSPHTVPTSRKLREVVFKVLARRIKAARVLDLGAGSGTIGFEAISRGAMLATFVERSARMCTFIRKNLTDLGVKDGHGEVVEMEITPFLLKCSRRKRLWDLVYFDLPPGDEHAVILNRLSRGCAIKTGGLLLMEHASDTTYPENISKLKRWRTIDQGERILTIYERI